MTDSGSTRPRSCIIGVGNPSGCTILPQLSLQFTGLAGNIPPNAPIVVDSCDIAADPRVLPGPAMTYTTATGALLRQSPQRLAVGECVWRVRAHRDCDLCGEDHGQHSTSIRTGPRPSTNLDPFRPQPWAVLGNNPGCGTQWSGRRMGAGARVESTTPEVPPLACFSTSRWLAPVIPRPQAIATPSVVVEGTVLAGTECGPRTSITNSVTSRRRSIR